MTDTPSPHPPSPQLTITPDRIHLTVNLTDDHQGAALTALFHWRMKTLGVVPIFLGVGASAGVLFLLSTILITRTIPAPQCVPADPASWIAFLTDLIIAMFALVAFFAILKHRVHRHRGAHPFDGTNHFDFGPDGVERKGDQYCFHLAWPMVDTVLITPTTLWLFYPSGDGWWIPRACFGTASNLDAVIAFIRDRNPAAKILRHDGGSKTPTS